MRQSKRLVGLSAIALFVALVASNELACAADSIDRPNAHDPSNLPIILAGGGYRHGQYVAYDKKNNIPLCNLFVNMLNNMGMETESFASSTGTLNW